MKITDMNAGDSKCGSLLFFRKNGHPGTTYPLSIGKTCIGSSDEADIRLKISDNRLEAVHCIIDVSDNGIATLLNKSVLTPISVNQNVIRKFKVLNNEDKIVVLGKQFQYINHNLSDKDVEKYQTVLNKAISTPKKRQSVAHSMDEQDVNFKTKTPLRNKSFPKKPYNRFGTEFTVLSTPIVARNRSNSIEQPKTTSKITASKALGSPARIRKRLSLDSNFKKQNISKKVSARNIQLSDDISSTIMEESSFSKSTKTKFTESLVKTPKSKNLAKSKTQRITPLKSELNISVNNRNTPVNRRLTVDNIPGSIKTLTPNKSVLKTLRSSKSQDLIDFEEKMEAPKLVNLEVNSLSQIKNDEKLFEIELNIRNPEIPTAKQKRQHSIGNIKSNKKLSCNRRKSEGNILDSNNTRKSFPRRPSVRGNKISSVDSEDLSDSSVLLNLSSGSSVSPRKTISSVDSDTLEVQNPDVLSDTFTRYPLNSQLTGNGIQETNFSNYKPERKMSRRNSHLIRSRRSSRKSKFSEEFDRTGQILEENKISSINYGPVFSSTAISDNYMDINEFNSSPESIKLTSETNEKENLVNDTSGRKFFVPQRRPSIKRSYIPIENDGNVSSTMCPKSTSSQNQIGKSLSNLDSEIELNISAHSAKSNDTSKRLSRRSIGKYSKLYPLGDIPTGDKSGNISLTNNFVNDSISTDDELETYTYEYKQKSSPNKNQSEENISESEVLNISLKGRRSLLRNTSSYMSETSFRRSQENISVLTISDDSIKNTPENNTSLIILDTPFEETCKTSRKKLSKTMNSSIQDSELTTPKSAIRGRRSMSLPYKPIVENITPVTPLEPSGNIERGFKTPLNTPGLFEDIKKSVMKTRSRQRLSNSFIGELNKNTAKRERESTGSIDISTKKRKMMVETSESIDEFQDLDASFSSFATDEVFDSMADEQFFPNTPQDFKNLTDKPVINVPRTRSLTEPRKQKPQTHRHSLHAIKLTSQQSESDSFINSSDTSSVSNGSLFNNSTDASTRCRRSKRLSSRNSTGHEINYKVMNKWGRSPMAVKSPKIDLTDVRDVKHLLKTPRPEQSPKNDLTNIIGVKRLFSTPNFAKSPKNDLSDVAGIKKLLRTPKHFKSPVNDLSDVAGLKKLLSTPKSQKEPKNDLTDVAGVKKLLSTPKTQKSPKNDLTNVPNLRKIMSPKQQNSPKNDLSDVRGVKRIMRTPLKQKEPHNDLSDIEGVADIFTVPEIQSGNSKSDIENNENLFDKLFFKKPVRTYRGRSLSPITRKAMLLGNDKRKTLGDTPYSSPRLESWLKDQAVIRLQKVDNDTENENLDGSGKRKNMSRPKELQKENKATPKSTPRGRKKVAKPDSVEVFEKRNTRRNNKKVESTNEDEIEIPRKITRSRKNIVEVSADGVELKDKEKTNLVKSRRANQLESVETSFASPKTRSVSRKLLEKYTTDSPATTYTDDDELKSPQPVKENIAHNTRGKGAKKLTKKNGDEFNVLQRGRSRTVENAPMKQVGLTKNANTNEDSKEIQEEVQPIVGKNEKSVKRGQRKKNDIEKEESVKEEPVKRSKRGKAAQQKDNENIDNTEETHATEERVRPSRRKNATRKKDAEIHTESEETHDTELDINPSKRRKVIQQKEDNQTHNIKELFVADENIRSSRRRKAVSPVEDCEGANEEEADVAEEMTKQSRSRRGKKVIEKSEVDTTESVKRSVRNKKGTLNEDEEIKVVITNTRSRRQLVKAKVRFDIDEIVEAKAEEDVIVNPPKRTRRKKSSR